MSDGKPEPVLVRAGCGQQVISPPLGSLLAGYFHDRVAERIRDDLFARAVVVESGGVRLAFVSCDLIAMGREMADAAKKIIAANVGIPAENVLIGATHTHTGAEMRDNHAVAKSEEWAGELPGKIAAAVEMAAGSMFTATLRPGRMDVEGYAFNRLFRMKDGSELFGRRPGEMVGVAGPIDPELQTLSIVDEEERLRGLIVNYALHVDVIGGGSADFVSADWPGEMARNVAAVYGEDVVTVFLQGTAGDINHNPHEATALPTRGPEKAIQLGRALAGAAMLATERAEPLEDGVLEARVETLPIPYYTRDAALMAEVEELKKKEELTPFEQYTVRKGENWPYDGKIAAVPVQVMRIGDVGVVALPAEIFARIGLEIKQFSPAPFTLVVELANADVSIYVPTTDQAERGAYGARPILSRWLCSDAGRQLADAAQVMLWKLWE